MLDTLPSPIAEISLRALKDNYKMLSRRIAPAPLLCVIKANAYGHGAAEVTRALSEAGASFFALANGSEALSLLSHLKDHSFCKEEFVFLPKLHILGSVSDEELLPLCHASAALSVHSLAYAEDLNDALASLKSRQALAQNFRLPVSIKCESGMNRLGISRVSQGAAIFRLPHLYPVALYSHFAEASAPFEERTALQLRRFRAFAATLFKCERRLFTHLSASEALLSYGTLRADGARSGLALYGLCQARGVPFRPAMRLSATVLSVKRVKKGEGVGYGSFRLNKSARIACLAIGYADGIPLTASGARIRIKGNFCPIVGEICMDRTLVDIGNTPLKEGERVLLFGEDTLDTLRFARECGTSPYALLSVRSERTKRIFY